MIVTTPVKIVKSFVEFTRRNISFIKNSVYICIEHVSAAKNIDKLFAVFKLVVIDNFYWIILNSTKNENHSVNTGTRVSFYKLENLSYL